MWFVIWKKIGLWFAIRTPTPPPSPFYDVHNMFKKLCAKLMTNHATHDKACSPHRLNFNWPIKAHAIFFILLLFLIQKTVIITAFNSNKEFGKPASCKNIVVSERLRILEREVENFRAMEFGTFKSITISSLQLVKYFLRFNDYQVLRHIWKDLKKQILVHGKGGNLCSADISFLENILWGNFLWFYKQPLIRDFWTSRSK